MQRNRSQTGTSSSMHFSMVTGLIAFRLSQPRISGGPYLKLPGRTPLSLLALGQAHCRISFRFSYSPSPIQRRQESGAGPCAGIGGRAASVATDPRGHRQFRPRPMGYPRRDYAPMARRPSPPMEASSFGEAYDPASNRATSDPRPGPPGVTVQSPSFIDPCRARFHSLHSHDIAGSGSYKQQLNLITSNLAGSTLLHDPPQSLGPHRKERRRMGHQSIRNSRNWPLSSALMC